MQNAVWQSINYYKALSNPKRLTILKLLHKNERSVGEIVQMLHVRQSNISQHLIILKLAGFIGMRRNGKKVFYYLKKSII
jgi:DNA-binding transcriptional ArsR family regulator